VNAQVSARLLAVVNTQI